MNMNSFFIVAKTTILIMLMLLILPVEKNDQGRLFLLQYEKYYTGIWQ